MAENICVAFALIADLCIALDQAPLQRYPDCWECDVDARWHLSVNGYPIPKPNRNGSEVAPFTAAIEFNGWPAGLVTPHGGVIAAGEAANEETLIDALRDRITALTGKDPLDGRDYV